MDGPGRSESKQLPPVPSSWLSRMPRTHVVLSLAGALFGLGLATEGLVAIARVGPRPGLVLYSAFFALVAVGNGFGLRHAIRVWRDPEGESAKRQARHQAMLQLPRRTKLRRAGLVVAGLCLVLLATGLLLVLGAHRSVGRVMGWVLVTCAAAFAVAGAYRLTHPVHDLDPPGEEADG